MKVKVKKDPDTPKADDKPESKDGKKKRIKIKDDKTVPVQYGIYSGIVNEKGSKSNPKESEAISNMVNYMKNNNPPESDNPSNVYRPQFSHLGINYDRKKKQFNA